jgi:hypothetical protein
MHLRPRRICLSTTERALEANPTEWLRSWENPAAYCLRVHVVDLHESAITVSALHYISLTGVISPDNEEVFADPVARR